MILEHLDSKLFLGKVRKAWNINRFFFSVHLSQGDYRLVSTRSILIKSYMVFQRMVVSFFVNKFEFFSFG